MTSLFLAIALTATGVAYGDTQVLLVTRSRQ